MTVESPCVDICRIDSRTRWCLGCGRTGEEIKTWQKMSPYRQRVALADLRRRMLRLSAGTTAIDVSPPAD